MNRPQKIETLWEAKWLATLDASHRRRLPTAIGRMPPYFFLRAVRFAEKNRIRAVAKLAIEEGVGKRRQAKDQTISCFCCLVGDKILEMDGSETIKTASAAARERTNCFSNVLRGCCHRRVVCGNRYDFNI